MCYLWAFFQLIWFWCVLLSPVSVCLCMPHLCFPSFLPQPSLPWSYSHVSDFISSYLVDLNPLPLSWCARFPMLTCLPVVTDHLAFFYLTPYMKIKKKLINSYDHTICGVIQWCQHSTPAKPSRFCPTNNLESRPPSKKCCVITSDLTKKKKKQNTTCSMDVGEWWKKREGRGNDGCLGTIFKIYIYTIDTYIYIRSIFQIKKKSWKKITAWLATFCFMSQFTVSWFRSCQLSPPHRHKDFWS